MSSAENIYRVTDWRARVCWLSVDCQRVGSDSFSLRALVKDTIPHASICRYQRTVVNFFSLDNKKQNLEQDKWTLSCILLTKYLL